MRRGLAILISAGLLGSLGVVAVGSASADPPAPCPDGFFLVPKQAVPQGDAKDHNGNGLVCAKPLTDPNGGPDDNEVLDDLIV